MENTKEFDYSLPTTGIKLKNIIPSISETSERERESAEKLNKGVETSTRARNKITSVFDRSGKRLSASLDAKSSTSIPITVESGVNKTDYKPK